MFRTTLSTTQRRITKIHNHGNKLCVASSSSQLPATTQPIIMMMRNTYHTTSIQFHCHPRTSSSHHLHSNTCSIYHHHPQTTKRNYHLHSTLSQQQQKEQQQGKEEEQEEFVDEDHSNNTLLEEQDAKESMSETEIQKNQYLDHFSRLKKLIFKFEQIVEDEKNNGIGEVITETPMQDKEALMKSVVDELKKMVYSLEKMVFIEAAHLLTAESEDDVVIESIDNREDEWNKDLFENDDEAEEEEEGEDDESSAVSSSSKNNSKNKKRYSQADVFMDEQVEDDTQEAFDESFTPIDSALYNQLIQVLQYIGSSMERGEVACSLLTKIYELMTRLANEYANAPAELFKQPFFKDNAMIRLNTDMFNQLLKSYALHGSNQNVVIVLQDMKEREIKANAHTYHGLIQLAMYHGDYVRATKILEYARQCGFEPLPETLALFNEEQEDF